MATTVFEGRTFDARPDRLDLRDRIYTPKLSYLPPAWPDDGQIAKYLTQYGFLVLDQGQEGACTGFGLAGMINYLQWRINNYDISGLKPVSPRMLYQMAKLYDEWAGEDYTGSSCRGAMKGWQRHGVCTDFLWPYRNAQGAVEFMSPSPDWEQDAASRPLGAYFRIEKDSINDLQSAISEVGAIYCSANVHKGWYLDTERKLKVIKQDKIIVGGHAFVLVGFNAEGFIVQNSWGCDWGFHGFAILSYQDWRENGTDAWVAVLGVPMHRAVSPTTFSTQSLHKSVSQAGVTSAGAVANGFKYKNDKVRPMDESNAYLQSIILGNNGVPIQRIVTVKNAVLAVEHVSLTLPAQWFDARPGQPQRLAVYVHGGLNSEENSIKRIQVMAPYFRENGIYPVFVTWKTGALESIGGIIEDRARDIFRSTPFMRDEGITDRIKEALEERRDGAIEVACENLLVRPMWTEMKQNAVTAAEVGGGISLLALNLIALQKKFPNLEIHLAGHSAGAIVLAYLLNLLNKGSDQRQTVKTLTLFAPASTLEFSAQIYDKAIKENKLRANSVQVEIMDDERERADTVGPYGKSLLYLISRALESRRKTPLMGMQWAWPSTGKIPQDQWSEGTANALADWASVSRGMTLRLHGKKREYVSTGANQIRLSHGSFDNDILVVSDMLQRMLGGKSLVAKVENLAY